MSPVLRPVVVAVRAVIFLSACSSAVAATEADVLPTVQVLGSQQPGFSTQRANTTKSDKPLFETPQSISVVTRELLDARQAITLDEAIETVAGVTSSTLGRRGWDDFIIRGQTASDTMYLDGLRIGQANWIAQEIYGVEQVEVIKGPASIYFGQVTPGGTVNLISKRPRLDAFNQIGLTVGSYGYRQGTFDFGRPLDSANGKAAIRVNGMASNSDDPTDGVWYKNRYIAPSLTLDLGARTDLTILTALNRRSYVRQQGIPLNASGLVNNGVSVPEGFFTGDYTVAPYEAEQKSLGYVLAHRFDNGWTLNQTYRHLEMEMQGQLANISGALNAAGNVGRNVLSQDFNGHSNGLDTNLSSTLLIGGMQHSVLAGIDLMSDKLYKDSRRCAIAAQNIYKAVYGRPVTACAITSIVDTTLSQAGLYLRDVVDLNQQLSLSMSLRHDRAKLKTIGIDTKTSSLSEKSANTGHVGLMYKATPNIAPYVSYATSFLPQTGLTYPGNPIDPEEGKQSEIGAKFLSDDKRLSASFAYYDLTRKNLSQTDPVNAGFQVTIGEQRTKGYEAELGADLRNGWKLSGALSILDAVITQGTATDTGKWLSNVPRKSANMLANYHFSGALAGLETGLGVRYVGEKTTTSASYVVPAYTVADASLSYQGRHYRVQLNVKNLFDRDYFAGASNANWVPLGNPRTIMLKTVFDF